MLLGAAVGAALDLHKGRARRLRSRPWPLPSLAVAAEAGSLVRGYLDKK